MKRIITLTVLLIALFIFTSCGFVKTTTHYKDSVMWGMSPDEVSEELGDLVVKKTGDYIIAEDDEREAVGVLASVLGGGEPVYKFTSDGKLYKIEFEVKDPWIDYEKFTDLVDAYTFDFENLNVGEITKDEHSAEMYSEYCKASCNPDEYTEFRITYIKHYGFYDNMGSITVSYCHEELDYNVLING